jgi:hypothetical protein
MGASDTSAEQAAYDLIFGLRVGWLVSRALHVAAELGVADHLSEGPRDISELAAATNSHPQSLYRLLRMLASYGVFAETADRHFGLTPAAALLRSGILRDAVRMFSDADWNAAGALLHNIKTGQPAFKHVNGQGFFEYLGTHPESQTRFDRAMASAAEEENLPIANAYDFSKYRRIVDVGGGRGGFLAAILKTYPSPRGVLYDQPQVVEHPEYLTKGGVRDRCDVVGGTGFFASIPVGADLYVLKRVLHDWPDDVCEGILRRCRDAVAKDGRVVVVDAVIPAGNHPDPTKAVDLLMMILLDGRERTETDFRELFARAGLKLTRIVATPSMLSIVEGEPA